MHGIDAVWGSNTVQTMVQHRIKLFLGKQAASALHQVSPKYVRMSKWKENYLRKLSLTLFQNSVKNLNVCKRHLESQMWLYYCNVVRWCEWLYLIQLRWRTRNRKVCSLITCAKVWLRSTGNDCPACPSLLRRNFVYHLNIHLGKTECHCLRINLQKFSRDREPRHVRELHFCTLNNDWFDGMRP